MRETLHIYLHEPWRTAAEAGEVNLFNRMARALPDWRLRFHADSEGERARAAARGFGLFHMHEPTAPTVLCLRRAYAYPFWRIEATNERWNFDVARADFDPATVPEAARFHAAWRQRLLPGVGSRPEGFLFMPLQGILLRRRSFQSMSPVAMIEAVLAADPRPVRATLHPREDYGPRERAALEGLERRYPRFRVEQAPADRLLSGCDAVVTENSSLAFRGCLLAKPAVLFARIDFHHVAAMVHDLGVGGALARAAGPPPAFARYLWWFWMRHAINAGAPDAEARIARRLAEHGWPVP